MAGSETATPAASAVTGSGTAAADEALLVLVSAPEPAAETLAEALVAEGLAACVNRLGGLRSVYRWQGEVARAQESLLLIKCAARGYPALEAAVRRLHPYELPEVVAVPWARALPAYRQWVLDETR